MSPGPPSGNVELGGVKVLFTTGVMYGVTAAYCLTMLWPDVSVTRMVIA